MKLEASVQHGSERTADSTAWTLHSSLRLPSLLKAVVFLAAHGQYVDENLPGRLSQEPFGQSYFLSQKPQSTDLQRTATISTDQIPPWVVSCDLMTRKCNEFALFTRWSVFDSSRCCQQSYLLLISGALEGQAMATLKMPVRITP